VSEQSRARRAARQKRRWVRENKICTICQVNLRDRGPWCNRCRKVRADVKKERAKLGKDWDGSPVKLGPTKKVIELAREAVRNDIGRPN
jgi:hypothetical protein